ncbi:hypothetical protein ACFQXA_07415 [Nocardiopsis composta]
MRDPHGDAVTDPCRVRVPVRSPHPREFAAMAGRDLGGQAPDEGGVGRIAMLVERMDIRTGLLHHAGILPRSFRCRSGRSFGPLHTFDREEPVE